MSEDINFDPYELDIMSALKKEYNFSEKKAKEIVNKYRLVINAVERYWPAEEWAKVLDLNVQKGIAPEEWLEHIMSIENVSDAIDESSVVGNVYDEVAVSRDPEEFNSEKLTGFALDHIQNKQILASINEADIPFVVKNAIFHDILKKKSSA